MGTANGRHVLECPDPAIVAKHMMAWLKGFSVRSADGTLAADFNETVHTDTAFSPFDGFVGPRVQ